LSHESEKPGVRFAEAGPSDDADLRRLLRDNPVPGGFSLAFVREPDFFRAAAIEGDVNQGVIMRDEASGRLIGVGARAVRDGFVNGARERLGYLGQLRIDQAFRGRRGLLRGGFAEVRRLHEADGATRLYLTTIIEGAEAARRALTSGRPGLPTYEARGRLCTLALPLWRRRRLAAPAGVRIRQAGDADLGDLVACLGRNLGRYQLAPAWSEDDLRSVARTPDLSSTDFWVAERAERVIGCVARWDQSGFKQTVVHGYRGALRLARPLVNLCAPLIGVPRLPAAGQPLPHAYLSHAAVDGDDVEVWLALASRAFDASVGGPWSYLTFAFSDGHPLLEPTRRAFRTLQYWSVIYVVYWEDGREAAARLDERVCQPELAIL
jgi:hypothetical protein